LDVSLEDPRKQEFRQLFDASDAYSIALYPAEGRHPVDPDLLAAPNARFLVARLNGNAIGCVALVLAHDGAGELKRMIVLPEFRGQGAGSHLLRTAEYIAASEAVDTIRLETGPHNLEEPAYIAGMAIATEGHSDRMKLVHIAPSWKGT
jgi:putative acetyltransferase